MSRAAGRRGMLVVAGVLLLVLIVADLLRPNSLLKGFFGVAPPSRQEEVLDGVRRRGIPVPDRTGMLTPVSAPSATSVSSA